MNTAWFCRSVKRQGVLPVLVGLIWLLVPGGMALAVTTNWVGSTGSWHNASNWDNSVPTIWDQANIGNGGTAQISSNDAEAFELLLGINNTGRVEQTGSKLTVLSSLSLGYSSNSNGTFLLSSGFLEVGYSCIVGYLGGGTFNQTGGNFSSNFIHIGWFNTGIFNQDNGSLTADSLRVGYESEGTYNLTYGNSSVKYLEVGSFGNGFVNQTGGSLYIHNILSLGVYYHGIGTYNLNGTGDLKVDRFAIIGREGTGNFNQDGGHLSVATMYLGDSTSGVGNYELSNGSISSYESIVGYQGQGTFVQSGGSHSINTNLILGTWQSGVGTYTLSGGELSATNEYIGNYGTATFNHSGGTNTATSTVYLGYQAGGNGTYNLTGSSFFQANEVVAGYYGTGTFTQSGGTHILYSKLILGYNANAAGTYTLSGGVLSCVNQEIIGYGGAGTFIQTGGSNSITNTLAVGHSPGSTGAYHFLGGSLSAGAITVYRTGTFKGAGSLTAGTFTNHGLVQPGASVGTLNITGNYVQTSYGNLEIEIASPTSFDKLNISGTAQLAGTLTPILVGGYTPSGTVAFPFLTAAGGVSGTFDVLNSPTVKFTLKYYPTWVELLFKRDYTDPSLGLTPNQWQVGNLLNQVAGSATGDLSEILNIIDDLPTAAAVRGAFQDISPDKAAALPQLGLEAAVLLRRSLTQRLTDLRFGPSESNAGAGLFKNPFSLFGSRSQGIMLAYNAASLTGLVQAGKGPEASLSRWGVFLDPQVILGHQSSTVNQTGYDYTLAGFTLGADYRLGQNFLLGLATGYSHTAASFKGTGGNLSNNTWPLSAYAAFLPERGYAFLSLGYSLNLFDLERKVVIGGLKRTAKGSTTGHQFNLHSEAGCDFKLKPVVLTPMASLAYSHIGVDGFTETGAGALNLKVAAQSADSLQLGVGAKVAVPLKRDKVTVVPQVYASYQHEFLNGKRGLDARLSAAGGTFSFRTDHVGRDFAVVGGNVTVLGRRVSGYVNYNAEVGRSRYSAHYLGAGLRLQF